MSAFAGVDPYILRQRLNEAQSALNDLLIGRRAVTVSHDGRTVTYHQTGQANLRAYIAELQAALGIDCGSKRRAIRFR